MQVKIKGKVTVRLDEQDWRAIKESPLEFEYQGFVVKIQFLKGNDYYSFSKED
jgi:hypothetical protein